MRISFMKSAFLAVLFTFLIGGIHVFAQDERMWIDGNEVEYSLSGANLGADCKIVSTEDGKTMVTSCSKGIKYAVPNQSSFDFSHGDNCDIVYSDDFMMKVSEESAQGYDVKEYIDYYYNRFILSENWQNSNNVTLLKNEWLNWWTLRIDLKANDLEGMNYYSYIYFLKGDNTFWLVRYKYKDAAFADEVTNTVYNLYVTPKTGAGKNNCVYTPKQPDTWNEETKQYYSDFANKFQWGVYARDSRVSGIEYTIPKLEYQLDRKFDILLTYTDFNAEIPTDYLNKVYSQGRICEFTFQTSDTNNSDVFGLSTLLEVYKGNRDEQIRQRMRELAAFGHPVLFRLNNEMNSDWCSYSGVVNLLDPDIYKEVWKRIYRIASEESANNLIWIWNPNDCDYPPASWNNFTEYFPGDEYCQLIGVTGYNTGTFYLEQSGEHWREFKEIYDGIYQRYSPFFSDYNWIITEFASSSVGGDKGKWIDGMFKHIGDYPNIKAAVWFDDVDYLDPETMSVVARPYWVDETPDSLRAFIEGIRKMKAQ